MAGFYAQWDVKGGRVVGRKWLSEPPPPDMDDCALFMWYWERGYRRAWQEYLRRRDAAAEAGGAMRRGRRMIEA